VRIVEEENAIVLQSEGAHGYPSGVGMIDAEDAAVELETPFSADWRVGRATSAGRAGDGPGVQLVEQPLERRRFRRGEWG
jgi:hypothetical protein